MIVEAAPIDVAVGVLIRDDGSFLVARRPDGKPMAGYWEFPGGKVEPGESVFDALVREFDEELGLHIVAAHPWVQRVVTYPHATVRLHFWRSFGAGRGWHGEPRSREGQAVRWEQIDQLTTEPWLEGAWPVKRWLRMPATYAISAATTMGVDAYLEALDRRLSATSIALLQLREPLLDAATFAALFDRVRERCTAHGVRLVVNSVHGAAFRERADGVHLTSRDLMASDARPTDAWCIASCHDRRELDQAGRRDLDAVVLGPVLPTASHPGQAGLGWKRLAGLAAIAGLPVYAIGGLGDDDLPTAIASGAHGIAMIRGAWTSTTA